MKIEIPAKYKPIILTIKWLAIIASIIVSFFTFSTLVAVLISTIIVLIGLFVERIIFKYNFLYINPTPKIRKEPQQVSVAVGIQQNKGMEQPFIGLVYRTETEAKEEFNYFKSLNSNRFKDEDNEIIVSYVFEDEKRYTLFIYPNITRTKTMENIADYQMRNGHNLDKKIEPQILSFVRYFPSIFTGEGDLKEILTNVVMPKTPYALKTMYFENGQIQNAQKKSILKYHMRIIDRDELNPQDMEYGFKWYDVMTNINK
ncbi:hypothetical protein BACCIP111899_04395 [Bacillus rhizoplanae]|uniref:SMODS-associated NUDIX domain-containing protein n=1 Tax=Bacillus rhizoplanae TaxID=2880966 RepID=A0ABM8YHL7_9BACI|nr:hypothetical protein [Bacillus rhizoplanae]CAG9615158.1 hypothetical protein BACCIP111899_04395 [Bacillus rhizoplanae]